MKHNTHIYLASKAIEFTYKSVDNMRYSNKRFIATSRKRRERYEATHRQRFLKYYQGFTEEATWAPDDVLSDNKPYHIFKLFTDEEFPGHILQNKKEVVKDGVTYYKYSGGLPFRVDHIAQSIIGMSKLREYNDQFSMGQIMYQYLLLSHYVADAHVPMHCDLRDDSPGLDIIDPNWKNKTDKPRGRYLEKTAHSELEEIWDQAVMPVAIREEIIDPIKKVKFEETEYSDSITFDLDDCRKRGDIEVIAISDGDLMDFMIDVCIKSKIRCQKLFSIETPETRNDAILDEITREIFAECIGDLMSIWAYIWAQHQK
ncbi:MAG: hypothetical protein SVM80_10880 [Halobacteriota archaeon]|nr:hypothetical protein [Halobacteriota archaeon]